MDNHTPLEVLTNDEKKAAAAAFARRPFNPAWSEKARLVYDGIINALPSAVDSMEEAGELTQETSEPEKENTNPVPNRIPFQQALDAGSLIDVTSTARQLGISFPVTLTKPLWEVGIAPTKTTTEEERSARLRDVLMAFRLRLATQPTVSPLIDFPALLAFPPTNIPQPIPLFALIQPDEEHRAVVTLLLPNEVSTSIIPVN